MCYSARIIQDHRQYTKSFGARIGVKEFVDLFWRRRSDPKIKIPKAMEAAFAELEGEEGSRIRAMIDEFKAQTATELEQKLFIQRKRLADAERALLTKTTKALTESKRIASDKIDDARAKLADLQRTELRDDDARIFPGHYAPVMVMEGGKRVVKPMRYQCRPAGKPAFYDEKYPGTYNARRDSLEGFWKGQFGTTHGIAVATSFYENVNRHRAEGRELGVDEKVSNIRLEFKPNPQQDMLVACLWSRWTAPGEPDLLSFAAITDDPPPEVAAAGHDRCIIPINAQNIEAWLNPDPADLGAQYAILDDRARPYYEHRLAA